MLAACPTVGWPSPAPDAVTALELHEHCSNSDSYGEVLARKLEGVDRVVYLDQLFRRRAGGFGDIKRFVAELANLDLTLEIEIDVFAYTFLCGAKNLDLVIPLSAQRHGNPSHYLTVESEWRKKLRALERYEGYGEPLPDVDRERYLGLRRIIARPGTRDEFRALATLMVSGPSTNLEISEDLGMRYNLSARILPSLESAGILQMRADLDNRYALRVEALPCVVFMMSEVGGVELLSILKRASLCSSKF